MLCTTCLAKVLRQLRNQYRTTTIITSLYVGYKCGKFVHLCAEEDNCYIHNYSDVFGILVVRYKAHN